MTELLAAPFPVVLAGPSGSGKTTVGRELVARRPDVAFSISATTRPPRPAEREGVDYRFLSSERFEEMVREEAFLEWAEVHGHRYGTPLDNLARARRDGVHLLLDIDVQGARAVRRSVPDALTVFLLPPSGATVVERLRGRRTEDDRALRRRLLGAGEELSAVEEFDYVVVNEDVEAAVRAVAEILAAERRRVARLGPDARERVRSLADEIERALG